eukprot:scaffold3337_cov204-Alexandrium_tamarense.AAC.33
MTPQIHKSQPRWTLSQNASATSRPGNSRQQPAVERLINQHVLPNDGEDGWSSFARALAE